MEPLSRRRRKRTTTMTKAARLPPLLVFLRRRLSSSSNSPPRPSWSPGRALPTRETRETSKSKAQAEATESEEEDEERGREARTTPLFRPQQWRLSPPHPRPAGRSSPAGTRRAPRSRRSRATARMRVRTTGTRRAPPLAPVLLPFWQPELLGLSRRQRRGRQKELLLLFLPPSPSASRPAGPLREPLP